MAKTKKFLLIKFPVHSFEGVEETIKELKEELNKEILYKKDLKDYEMIIAFEVDKKIDIYDIYDEIADIVERFNYVRLIDTEAGIVSEKELKAYLED